MDHLELIAHPVRLRIIHALSGGRTMTTSELCSRMPDVPTATLYRHVGLLADAGVLEVDSEQRVRGAVERRYRLRRERARIDVEQAASLSLAEHRRGFGIAMATLAAEFDAYLGRQDADPAADQVGYRQHALWLSEDERADLIADMRRTILARIGNEPAPGRTQYLLSPILFPIGDTEDGAPQPI